MSGGDETRFAEIQRAYYDAWFRYHPEAAVDVGAAGFAHRLPPGGEEARGALICLNDELRTSLDELGRAALTADAALDFDLLRAAAQLENQYLIDVEPAAPDPERRLPVHAIYQLTIRPVEDFAGALLARLKAIPEYLGEAREFLNARAAAIPPVWLESAVVTARSGIEFFRALPLHPKIVEGGGIAGLETVLHKAMHALDEHANFLDVDLRGKAGGNCACGRPYFENLLHQRHFLDVNADELRAFGEELVARTRAELADACRRLTGGTDFAAALARIHAQHPTREKLLDTYRQQMQAARAFVVAQDLVTLPATETLDVVETPLFLQHQIPFAAYCDPAPNDPAQRGLYYVTPPESEAQLAEHDFAGIQHTCVHEAWPGHHLQFVVANGRVASRSLPRLLHASATFYEGWALYTEQLMRERGFLGQPEQELLLLRDRLWRALRIVIDVGIHVRGEPLETGAQRLVQELGFDAAHAQAELMWYSRAPTVPMGYATGWALINALRDSAGLPLKEFHDRLLSAGSIALPRVIQRAFGPQAWQRVRAAVFARAN